MRPGRLTFRCHVLYGQLQKGGNILSRELVTLAIRDTDSGHWVSGPPGINAGDPEALAAAQELPPEVLRLQTVFGGHHLEQRALRLDRRSVRARTPKSKFQRRFIAVMPRASAFRPCRAATAAQASSISASSLWQRPGVRFLGVMASVMSASLTPENIMPVFSGSKAPGRGHRPLAPLYDLLATLAYPDLSPNFAMKIGRRATLAELDAKGWTAFAGDAGLGLPLVRRRVAEISESAIARANEIPAELARPGLDEKALLQLAEMVVDRAERCAHSTRGNEVAGSH